MRKRKPKLFIINVTYQTWIDLFYQLYHIRNEKSPCCADVKWSCFLLHEIESGVPYCCNGDRGITIPQWVERIGMQQWWIRVSTCPPLCIASQNSQNYFSITLALPKFCKKNGRTNEMVSKHTKFTSVNIISQTAAPFQQVLWKWKWRGRTNEMVSKHTKFTSVLIISQTAASFQKVLWKWKWRASFKECNIDAILSLVNLKWQLKSIFTGIN